MGDYTGGPASNLVQTLERVEPDGSASARASLLTLNRGLAILDLLASSPGPSGLTHTEIAAHLGFQKSTLYRYLASLQNQRYIELIEGASRYRLGPSALTLGAAAMRQRAFASFAGTFVDQLAAVTGEMAHATVLDREDSVTVAIADGGGPVGPRISVGSRRPAHVSASGKVFLAFAQEAVLERYLSRPLVGSTSRSIVKRDQLLRELATVRRAGFAIDRAEYVEGICCVAAPVFDMSGRVCGSLSLSVAVQGLGDDWIARLTAPLLEHTRRFSRLLIGQPE